MAVITIVKKVKKIHPKEIVILIFLVAILICLISRNFKISINKVTNSINQDSKVSTNIDFNTSDADAFILIDDKRNAYKDYTGKQVEADFWSFLLKDKRNSIKDSKCTIIDKEGTTNTKIKKIKGRGNSSWIVQEKKPFNASFYNTVKLGNTISKKFSFISTTKDSTMLKNKIIFDLSNFVGLPYSPNISFIDLYINEKYRGCYTVCEKVELGENQLVALDDNSKKSNKDFNFLVEVDVWNYDDNTTFVTENSWHIALKTPKLEDYNEKDENMKEKYEFIKNTYQKLDNALYKGSLEDLENICDIESLAKMYLVQEFGKNCDGGFTSTFFTYNAEEKKFYAGPIWDCDTAFGSYDIVRDGCTSSSANFKGWLTKDATYNGVVSPLAQPFKMPGKTSDGRTFEEICKEIWNEKFIPAINILLGDSESKERLKSIDEYAKSYEKAIHNNYNIYKLECISPTELSGLEKMYSKDYDGELAYMKDWAEARMKWMTEEFR